MKPIFFALLTGCCAGLFFSGCTTQTDIGRPGIQQNVQAQVGAQPSTREMAETLEKLTKLNQALIEENTRLKREKEDAETAVMVADNKEGMLPQLTELFRTNAPSILMETYGFQGSPVDYQITDVAFKTNTLFMEQQLLWKLSDGSGKVAVIVTGLDVDKQTVVFLDLQKTTPVTADELARAYVETPNPAQTATDSAPTPPVREAPAQDKGIDLKPNNETVNAGYQTAIKVAGAGLLIWLSHLATQGD